MEGTIQIKVLKAELTINTDWFGNMDPYVILKLNEQMYQTSIKKNAGKLPSWDENFAFRAKEGDVIRIDVMDKDFLKTDDVVGQGVFEIKDILCDNKEIVIKLYRNISNYSGLLYLQTKFFPDPSEYVKMIGSLEKQINFQLKEIEKLQKELRNTNKLIDFEESQKKRKYVIAEACAVDDRKEKLEEEFKGLEHSYELQIREINMSIESHKKTIALLNDNIKRAQEYITSMNNETLIYKNPPGKGKLFITCKDGNFSRNISLGTMDPYAVFLLKNKIYKTKVAKNGGKTPNWGENFDFLRDSGENILRVEVYHKNDLVGYGFLNINWIVIRGSEYNTQIKLFYMKEIIKDAGYINVSLRFEKE